MPPVSSANAPLTPCYAALVSNWRRWMLNAAVPSSGDSSLWAPFIGKRPCRTLPCMLNAKQNAGICAFFPSFFLPFQSPILPPCTSLPPPLTSSSTFFPACLSFTSWFHFHFPTSITFSNHDCWFRRSVESFESINVFGNCIYGQTGIIWFSCLMVVLAKCFVSFNSIFSRADLLINEQEEQTQIWHKSSHPCSLAVTAHSTNRASRLLLPTSALRKIKAV